MQRNHPPISPLEWGSRSIELTLQPRAVGERLDVRNSCLPMAEGGWGRVVIGGVVLWVAVLLVWSYIRISILGRSIVWLVRTAWSRYGGGA